MPREGDFKSKLIREIRYRLPGCIILKNDPNYLQGIPDLIVLHEDNWAALECKDKAGDKTEPNQIYYVNLMNGMSFSAFIYPENKEEVLRDLQRSFRARRTARLSRAKQVSLD